MHISQLNEGDIGICIKDNQKWSTSTLAKTKLFLVFCLFLKVKTNTCEIKELFITLN
jgi:hypothetical protein